MLSKTILFVAIALLVAKVLFRVRFRGLGRRLDRAVNVTLVLLVVVYCGHVAWWAVVGR